MRWSVLVSTPGHTWAQPLPSGRSVVVGQGPGAQLEVPAAGLAERHLSLMPTDGGVVVEPLRGGGDVLLNDVPLVAQATVRAGDELVVGRARLVFAVHSAARPISPRVVPEDDFMNRLAEEVRRAGTQRPLGLVLVSSPSVNVAARQALTRRVVDEIVGAQAVACFGQLALDLMGVVIPELEAAPLERLLAALPRVAGARARVTVARVPEAGLDAESLLGHAIDALMSEPPDGEVLAVDPVTVRLQGLLERLADDEAPVCLVGPPGSGRATLLEGMARVAGRRVSRQSALLPQPAVARTGDWVLLRDVDALSASELSRRVGQVRTRVLATATRPPPGNEFPHVLEVPALRDRPDELLPLADGLVSRYRVAVGRPRLTLSHEARALLKAWHWPGNVRELANVLYRAARATARDEVGRDALPARLSGDSEAESFKGAMQAAERELVLETLSRTRWNVTAAATRLGVPRRTLVHRMAKLGLKRPAR